MQRRVLSYPFLLLACLAMCWVTATDAWAQSDDGTDSADEDGYVIPTDEQTALNTSAVEAIKSEEYEQAVKLLRRSLELGPMNITYLNLGRAHQRLEECGAAEDAYLEAVSAPAVESPSPLIVEKKVEQYMEELDQECGDDDWEKTSSGSAGSEDGYSWEPEKQAAPMLRLGVGLGYGESFGFPGEGAEPVGGTSVAEFNHNGGALRLEGTGGYFLNKSLALHASFVVNIMPSPTTEYVYYDESSEIRDAEDTPERVGFSRLSVGMTGYVPGDVFISGGIGLSFGRLNDPFIDVEPGVGSALDLMLGKDFRISEQFAFGLGAYIDIVNMATNRTFDNTGFAIGLQAHGVMKFR